MYTKEDLVKYAIAVRKKCLKYAFMQASKRTAYHKEKNLMCMCAVASATLVQYLKNKGINSYCVATSHHCWVSVGPYFVDITCSQYGMSDYMVMKKQSFLSFVSSNYGYKYYKKVENYNEFFENWDNGQCPKQRVINKILTIED